MYYSENENYPTFKIVRIHLGITICSYLLKQIFTLNFRFLSYSIPEILTPISEKNKENHLSTTCY